VLEPFTTDTYGGHTESEAREIIMSPEWAERWQAMQSRVDQWCIEWGRPDLRLPTAQEAVDALFAYEPIVWSRLTDFQDVTMRLIGERLISGFQHSYGAVYQPLTFVQGELATHIKGGQIKIPLTHDRHYHLYCSEHNPGTEELAHELHRLCPSISFTCNFEQLDQCEHFVVRLTQVTWTRGAASDAFAAEVAAAMRLGVHCLLMHEVPGARLGDNEARDACFFEHFFEDDSTPKFLLKAGLYNEIAMNVAGGEWRPAGLLKTIQSLQKGGCDRKPVDLGEDKPALGRSATESWTQKVKDSRFTVLRRLHKSQRHFGQVKVSVERPAATDECVRTEASEPGELLSVEDGMGVEDMVPEDPTSESAAGIGSAVSSATTCQTPLASMMATEVSSQELETLSSHFVRAGHVDEHSQLAVSEVPACASIMAGNAPVSAPSLRLSGILLARRVMERVRATSAPRVLPEAPHAAPVSANFDVDT